MCKLSKLVPSEVAFWSWSSKLRHFSTPAIAHMRIDILRPLFTHIDEISCSLIDDKAFVLGEGRSSYADPFKCLSRLVGILSSTPDNIYLPESSGKQIGLISQPQHLCADQTSVVTFFPPRRFSLDGYSHLAVVLGHHC